MSNTRKTKGSATVADRPQAPEKAQPELLGKGRYSIYQTPDGDGVISYRPDGEDADQHQVVPAKFWSVLVGILSGQAKNLSHLEIMKLLMGGRK